MRGSGFAREARRRPELDLLVGPLEAVTMEADGSSSDVPTPEDDELTDPAELLDPEAGRMTNAAAAADASKRHTLVTSPAAARATATEGSDMPIRKAVIPAAGLGTRFLPATKSQQKAMLPVVDKPSIQYVVEEAVRAGLTDILIITGRGNRSLEDHFDRSFELEHFLESKGKFDELKQVQEISDMATIHYIRQKDPLGLGHAVSVAEEHVNGEPFAVLLGDDLIHHSMPLLPEMLRVHERYGRSVIAVQEVLPKDISFYGCVEPEFVEENLARVLSIVEKPSPEEAPSNLAAIGRYVLTHDIFDALRQTEPGAGGEIQLTDAINQLAKEQAFYAYKFDHGRYDVGNKLDYLKTTVEFALERDDIGDDFRRYLRDLLRDDKLG